MRHDLRARFRPVPRQAHGISNQACARSTNSAKRVARLAQSSPKTCPFRAPIFRSKNPPTTFLRASKTRTATSPIGSIVAASIVIPGRGAALASSARAVRLPRGASFAGGADTTTWDVERIDVAHDRPRQWPITRQPPLRGVNVIGALDFSSVSRVHQRRETQHRCYLDA
jgi:hypothetical protein